MQNYKDNINIEFTNLVKEKNGLTYVPWATAIAKFFETYPDGDYGFITNGNKEDENYDTFLFGNEKMGYFVKTYIEAEDKVRFWQLPILDFRNKPVFEPNVSDINKSQMRCLTKNIAVATGIGIPVYAGEEFQDAEVGVEIKKAREEVRNLANEIVRVDKTKTKDVASIVGNKGDVGKIETVEKAQEIIDKLNELFATIKDKKSTTKKEEK